MFFFLLQCYIIVLRFLVSKCYSSVILITTNLVLSFCVYRCTSIINDIYHYCLHTGLCDICVYLVFCVCLPIIKRRWTLSLEHWLHAFLDSFFSLLSNFSGIIFIFRSSIIGQSPNCTNITGRPSNYFNFFHYFFIWYVFTFIIMYQCFQFFIVTGPSQTVNL